METAIDGIIFDVDGTLWDSVPVVVRAYNDVLAAQPDLSIQITEDTLRSEFGKPMTQIRDDIILGTPLPRRAEIFRQILETQDRYLEETPPEPYPQMKETLQTLSSFTVNGTSHPVPLFIVSNCQAGYIERFLSVTGCQSLIRDHLCPDDSGLLKAGNIKKIVQDHHLANALYIGDVQGDCDATREAGILFCYAAYGFGHVDKPDFSIQKISDLPDKILQYT